MTGVDQTPNEHPDQSPQEADPLEPSGTEQSALDSGALDSGALDPSGAEQDDSDPGDDEEIDETAPLPAEVYDCSAPQERTAGINAARGALARHEVVVMPTDTVYGIAANAFSVDGVTALLEAKGRDRTMPPPVLIAHAGVLDGLADRVSDEARALAAAFWPGGLTLICHSQSSLQWDLGETRGTVALRVPDDELAQALLLETGPLAVSSANRTGSPAAVSAEQARDMLGDSVRVYLDDGTRSEGRDPRPGAPAAAPVSSTIVDCTGTAPVVVRHGQISLTRLREVVPSVLSLEAATAAAGAEAEDEQAAAVSEGTDAAAGKAASTSTAADEAAAAELDQASPLAAGTAAGIAAAGAGTDLGAGAPSGSTAAQPAASDDADASGTADPTGPSAAAERSTADDRSEPDVASGPDERLDAPDAHGSSAAMQVDAVDPTDPPEDPEADIVEEARAQEEQRAGEAADFSGAAPTASSAAAAIVAGAGPSASAGSRQIPDQDRTRPAAAAEGEARPLGLAEASALVAFSSLAEPQDHELRDPGVDQQR